MPFSILKIGPDRASSLLAAVTAMSKEERKQFFDGLHSWVAGWREAGYYILLEEEFNKIMDFANQGRNIAARLAKATADLTRQRWARNRQSDPQIVKRNIEICDLRREDSRKWSLGRLAKKYDLRKQTIARILSQESKWRQLVTER